MDSQLMEILFSVVEQVLLALIPIVVSALAAWLIPLAIKAWKRVGEASPEAVEMVSMIARVAVLAAEQAGLNEWTEDKKSWAVGVAQKWLDANGVKVDAKILSAAIEAAVFEEFNSWLSNPREMSDCVE